MHKIISAAERLTDTEAASIMLLDPKTGDLRFEITSNLNPNETDSIVVPMEGSTAGWIVQHGEPRVIEDVTKEPSHYHGVDDRLAFETRNLLGVPMRTHNKVIGVLQALNKHNDQRFNEQDIKILTTLASQAAIAIENARLFQQSDFIAEMVHELRTPLVALKASTALMLRPDLPEDRRVDIIHDMQSETERLISMTSDFLNLARLESGRAQLDKTDFDMQKLIRESVNVVQQQASDKDINVVITGGNFVVSGDRGKIKQVLLNLLTNAIKYNREKGTIAIALRPNQDQQDKSFVEVSVKDTGYGISKDNQQHMFQKFYRVANTAGFTQGTGLGLVISKHIVEAHKGAIWMESQEGVGSTFHFTLPLAQKY
ncbi:MAG: GAF domain-containing sensor histidine kinase [Anaerolineae bacterium]|nr:GAF domain-containing sensor histidine kinase [Anaerolineae bacterium]